jgi:IS30 family transposase
LKFAGTTPRHIVGGLVQRLPADARTAGKFVSFPQHWLTWDGGLEMAKCKTFMEVTNVTVYFCDPHSSWRRGTKTPTAWCDDASPGRTDSSGYAQSDLNEVALRLNQPPRETLGFQAPV